MLKLLIYAPCEKVVEAKDNTVSLISVMESIHVNVAPDLPADALAPIKWDVLTLWRRDENLPDDATFQEFEERTEVLRPDGVVAAGGTTSFRVSNAHLMYRSVVPLPVFPIGQPGLVWVQSQLRQRNPDTEWKEVARFPLLVLHLQNVIELNKNRANPEEVAGIPTIRVANEEPPRGA